jgi:hypothetical protein
MSIDYQWTSEDFHPLNLCFFCKKRPAVSVDPEERYKVIRRGEGFPGYVVNYATVHVPIPICNECLAVHKKESKQYRVVWIISWVITTLVFLHYTYSPADGLILCLVLSAVVSIALSAIPAAVLWVLWILLVRLLKGTDEVADKSDYPVVKRLKVLGWQTMVPHAKYGDRKNEEFDKQAIQRLHAEYLEQAHETIYDYMVWVQKQERQGKSASATSPLTPEIPS